MSKYSEILKIDRRRKTSVKERTEEKSVLIEAESDRGRILYCAAFRRLQQKAQVFSMEPNAAVRSRLTHSLEVSQIGRYIADTISRQLEQKNIADAEECFALVTFVENACLMHDIGNPPFGHFGEAAIRKWFKENGKAAIMKAIPEHTLLTERNVTFMLADFEEFDGNPQGLRVVTRLQRNKDEFGLNLTNTTLASYLKYVRMAGETIAGDSGRLFVKKAGYFASEQEIVDGIWSAFNYEPGRRFPLAYIMEAADDIAYCVSDLEDSIEKGLMPKKTALEGIKDAWSKDRNVANEFDKEILSILECAASEKDKNGEFTFTDFRTSLNRVLVRFAALRYLEKEDDIFAGTLDSLLPKDSGAGAILAVLKDYCKQHVYRHESVQRTELAGYTAIYGLLNHFKPLLDCSMERFAASLNYSNDNDPSGEPIIIEKKYLTLFPNRYKKVYEEIMAKASLTDNETIRVIEWNARAHLIVDFVAGMTDDFATTTYQTLSGMRLQS